MEPSVRQVVLFTVEQLNGSANGKTYLQKVCYFVQRVTKWPLGFRAHYYGPYSDLVSAELSFLTGAGLLDETRRGSGIAGVGGWEIARFDYTLTEDGRRTVERLAQEDAAGVASIRAAVKRVLDVGPQSYVDLSFAAKTDWILQSERGPMTFDGVARAATRFNWNVKGTDVKRATEFLRAIGLVEVRQEAAAGSE